MATSYWGERAHAEDARNLERSSCGPVLVTTSQGTTEAGSYGVLAKITAVSPKRAYPGNTVTLTGSGFTGVTSVRFGEVSVPSFMVLSDTSISCVFPTGGVTNAPTVVKLVPESVTIEPWVPRLGDSALTVGGEAASAPPTRFVSSGVPRVLQRNTAPDAFRSRDSPTLFDGSHWLIGTTRVRFDGVVTLESP